VTVRPLAYHRTLLAALAALSLAACGGDAPQSDGGAAADASTAATSEVPAAQPAAVPAPTDPGAPAAPARRQTPEEDSIAEARLYERRVRSMESYASCMKKTQGVEPPIRATLQRACANLPDAPGRK
jgi:hypothetical protein